MKIREIIGSIFHNWKADYIKECLEKDDAVRMREVIQDDLDNLNGAIEDLIFYQGKDQYIQDLRTYLHDSFAPVKRPPFLTGKDSARFEVTIWALLVIMYGDYEAGKPEFGFVKDRRKAIAHLNCWRNVTEGRV